MVTQQTVEPILNERAVSSKDDFPALLNLAECKFQSWHLKEFRPERDRRIRELKKQNLTSGGRAVLALVIYRETLEREVRERIRSYAAVAHDFGSLEMLSKLRLEEHRNRIMTTVGHAIRALRDHVERDGRAAGDTPESALPNELPYTHLQAEILDVVNTDLQVLEAESMVARRAEPETGVKQPSMVEKMSKYPLVCIEAEPNGKGPTRTEGGLAVNAEKWNGQGDKGGPKPDHEGVVRVNDAIEFFSCFISYSHIDKPFAERLFDTLQGRGIRCWLDEEQMLPGDDIYEHVDRGIHNSDKVLLCCSKDSLSIYSWWVDDEIDKVLEKERKLTNEQGHKVLALIPLDLDGHLRSGDWQNGKASQVRSRLAADFKGWEHDNQKFEAGVERVIRALRLEERGRRPAPKPKL